MYAPARVSVVSPSSRRTARSRWRSRVKASKRSRTSIPSTAGSTRNAPPERGAQVIKVLADDRSPPFAYTVGLDPEIVIFGLNADLDLMHHVLNEIGIRMTKGETFAHGAKKKDI